ncbi:hypothetical protein [Klebsiella pneumoniae]|uniref:hypothetical protein n=1 Tax=Klebsiella pneumoniae TaxID=573 RepID=UPI003D6E5039
MVINATQNGDKWQTLASDTRRVKTGSPKPYWPTASPFGKIYQNSLRADVESSGLQDSRCGVGMACGRWRACG